MPVVPKQLASADSFYAYLGVGAKERRFLERHAFYRYVEVSIPKRRGGTRTLLVPERRLKFLQRQILKLLSQLQAPRAPVHGFTKDRSSITNANEHQTRPFLLNIDLRNFFGAISRRRVLGLLNRLEIPEEVAEAICGICMTRNQLPQGAPTSPILSNMITYRLDRDLMRFAKTNRLRYTRYADDVTLSSYSAPAALFEEGLPIPGRLKPEQLSTTLRSVFSANGFEISAEKVWFSGPKSRKEVTGLIVNEFTNVKRTFVRDLRAALYKVETLGVAAAEKDYQARYKTDASLQQVLRGRLDWIAQVRGRSFSAYRTLAKRFNQQFPDAVVPILPTYAEIADRAVWIIEILIDAVCVQGTAFFLDGIGLVTADHVVDALPSGETAALYRPSDPSKKFKAAPSSRRCPHRDLAILSHDVPVDEYLSLPLATSPDHTNDDIIALGFPDYGPGDQLSKRRGHIEGRATKHGVKKIEVSTVLPDGISGGPIVNDRYQVIGIAHKGGHQEHKQLAIEVSELVALSEE